MSRATQWRDIATLDRKEMQFVLVGDGDTARLRLWNPFKGRWETDQGYALGAFDECCEPTLWMPIPPFPHET